MADHHRKTIRDRVKAHLELAAIPTIGTNIFVSRPTPLFSPQVPCICIYTLLENADEKAGGQKFYRDRIRLAVHVIVRESAKIDDELDAICEKIEAVLFPLEYLSDVPPASPLSTRFVEELDYKSTEMNLSTMGDKVHGSAIMVFEPVICKEIPYDPATLVELDRFGHDVKLVSRP
jgi:hypothetical protein